MSKSPPDQDVAGRLRTVRAQVFPSAAAAAEALGMKPGTVRAHENGQNGISYVDLERYARRYGASIDWLVSGRGEQQAGTGLANIAGSYPVMATIQDGAWLPDASDADEWPGWGPVLTDGGVPEVAAYADGRFPPEMISAFKVRTNLKDGPYTDGAVVFAIPAWQVGYRHGDHVIIVRERSGFAEWTLRRLRFENGRMTYEAVLSAEPAFEFSDGVKSDTATHIQGLVIGSICQRPVPTLDASGRAHYELERTLWKRKDAAT